MGSLASLTTLIKFVLLLCLTFRNDVHFVVGRGPDSLPTLPVWGAPKVDCSLFRNELVLKPKFGVWPEDIAGVPFQYCCEYQPGSIPSEFELSNYTYGPDGGTLLPAPYHDLGIVDNGNFGYYLLHWKFWGLSTKQFSVSKLYCDVNDLRRLYLRRLFKKALVRGLISFVVVCAVAGVPLFGPKYLIMRERDKSNIKRMELRTLTRYRSCSTSLTDDLESPEPEREGRENDQLGYWARAFLTRTDKEELFSDFCHILLLSFVGSCLMEGVAHSPVGGWRSQLMFNMAVTYTYLTFFAVLSVGIRHLLCPELTHTHKSGEDWRWQKVFGQLAAQLMVGAYLGLVEDVSGRSLDAVTGLVLGTCIGASVWSGGVELVVMARFGWQIVVNPFFKRAMKRFMRKLPPRHGRETQMATGLNGNTARSHHIGDDEQSNYTSARSHDHVDDAHSN